MCCDVRSSSQNRCEPELVVGKRPAAQTKGVGSRGVRSLFSTDLASFFARLPRGALLRRKAL